MTMTDAPAVAAPIATPWACLPTADQARRIAELTKLTGPDWTLVIDPVDATSHFTCWHDASDGPGVVSVNGGPLLCLPCALGLLSGPGGMLEAGVCVEVAVCRAPIVVSVAA